MSEIKVGDLVMVVRWPHACKYLGNIFGIISTAQAVGLKGNCQRCGWVPSCSFVDVEAFGKIPVDWLKRIDPLAEPETTEHNEELTA